jgi:death-on-curing protein
MSEPAWIAQTAILVLHDEQIHEHGGITGVRDVGAFESALARAQNKWAYGETDLFVLAAAYGFGLARNHPFSDGNKRTAALAAFMFLALNGWIIEAPTQEVHDTIFALAAGELDEEALAAWLRARAVPVG